MHNVFDVFDVIVYMALAGLFFGAVGGAIGYHHGFRRGARYRETTHRLDHAFRTAWRR